MTSAKLAYEAKFLKQMKAFDNKSLVIKLLKLYLDRCCWKHNLAFFQWRRKTTPAGNNQALELKEMYEGRVEHLRKVISSLDLFQTIFAKEE